MIKRNFGYQPDYIFSVVRVPEGWRPKDIFDVPPTGTVISRIPVASFDEAHDDLVRTNAMAMQLGLSEWAMIETAGADA